MGPGTLCIIEMNHGCVCLYIILQACNKVNLLDAVKISMRLLSTFPNILRFPWKLTWKLCHALFEEWLIRITKLWKFAR